MKNDNLNYIMWRINIYSKSEDWLGRALANPSYAKNNVSEYDIYLSVKNPLQDTWQIPENFKLPHTNQFRWALNQYGGQATAMNAWGYSVESWYFANTIDFKYKQDQKELIMYTLICEKLKTYPELIEEINLRGGLDFLRKCSHVVSGNKKWEGIGYNSNFIKILIFAFKNVTIGEDCSKSIIKNSKGLFG